MTPSEYVQNIESLIADIQATSMQNLGAATMDLVEKISTRVITEQENANNQKFDGYSQTKLPAFFYYSSARRVRKGLNEVKAAAKAGEKLSYADFRQLLGFSNASKNFELSGEMWAGFGIISVDESTETLVIGGRNKGSQEKIAWNSQREGISIIAATDNEIEELIDYRVDWLIELFKQNNLL